MGDRPRPARVPGEAPQALKDFVSCAAASVELDTELLGWIPSGGLGDAAPSITITPGTTPTDATIRVGWDFVGLTLPASIGADGELVVDTSNVPSIAGKVKTGVDQWVAAFNATMVANGKRLDRVTIVGTKVTITKRAVAATTPTEPVPVAPAVGGSGLQSGGVETPQPAPKDTETRWGCLAWAFGLLAVVGVGAGVFVATRDDGGADVATSVVASDPAPATEGPAVTDGPVVTDGPSASDAPAGTDAVAPSTEAVTTDGPPPSTEPPPPTSESTPLPSPIPDPFAGVFDAFDEALSGAGLTGDTAFLMPDASGDVVDCSTQTPLVNPGPDITGLFGTIDGDQATIIVSTAQSPLLTAEGFSFAVLLQAITVGNQQHVFQWETHDGVESIGQLDQTGAVDPATASLVNLTDGGTSFMVQVDPADPIAVVQAQAFNTRVEGDPTSCDFMLGLPFDAAFPLTGTTGTCTPDATTACVNNARFAVTLIGPGGPAAVTGSAFDDSTGFESGDVDAWARVVNGCGLNDHFWVFAAATTDVEYTLTVTDTATGTATPFVNPLSQDFPAITDTAAFATCP